MKEDFHMEQTPSTTGKTTIAPEVLLTIARLNTLSVPGVARLSSAPADVNQIFSKNPQEGVKISVDHGVVYADIYVVLAKDVNVREVGRAIQQKVSRAISEMLGMEVGKINVHVEDIDYSVEA
ncbi:hypothetical protein ANT_14620 [Anaerolinea thermophila UNI-1]|uniref:Alkaline shock protein n=2 Tax=Anaerolinea thermophila TaxID=167964 RepID=E8N4X6_ANATU|nr:hypothetical protein ANT_14620 [Anaerolinea thermophila UNI-1]